MLAELFLKLCSLFSDVLLLEFLSVLFSDVGSFIDDGEDSAHGFFEFEESKFADVFEVSSLLDDAVSKEYIFLSDTDIPKLMEVIGALDSKLVSIPSPTIGDNLILSSEGSHFGEFGGDRVDLIVLGKVEFEGVGDER